MIDTKEKIFFVFCGICIVALFVCLGISCKKNISKRTQNIVLFGAISSAIMPFETLLVVFPPNNNSGWIRKDFGFFFTLIDVSVLLFAICAEMLRTENRLAKEKVSLNTQKEKRNKTLNKFLIWNSICLVCLCDVVGFLILFFEPDEKGTLVLWFTLALCFAFSLIFIVGICVEHHNRSKQIQKAQEELDNELRKETAVPESYGANLTTEEWLKQYREQQQRNFEDNFINMSKGLPEDVFVRNELAKIDAMNGLDFERYCARLLYMFGFKNVKVTPSSGDFGVDIIAIDGATTFAVQCKRYSGNLGAKPIQEVYTGMRHYGANNALVITNSFFSDKAKQLADETGVTLWDRSCLQLAIKKCLRANEPSNTQSDTNSRSHRKHIPHVAGTKEYVEMYIYKENLERVYLVSEPFDTLEEANHFSDCMNDRFGCSALIEEKEDKFYSHSNWVERYKINSNFQPDKNVYVFSNWS